jgi:hypothetical protein
MNWPFSKPVVKQNIVPRIVQKDFEKEEKKIQQFEDVNKKFYKDVRRYIDAIDETNKSELKLINNLLNVMSSTTTTTTSPSKLTHSLSIPHLSTSSTSISARSSLSDSFNSKICLWKQTHLTQNQNYLEKLKLTCQLEVIEPMKKLNLIFPNVYNAIKRREQAYNELIKQQQKLEKLNEKDRVGPIVVKMNQQQQNVDLAKSLFQKEHLLLMDELPKLYDSRIKYIYPCIQQLIKSQIDFFSNYSTNYEKLLEDYNLNIIYNNSNASTSTVSSISSSSRSISSIFLTPASSSDQKNLLRVNDETVGQVDADIKKLMSEIKSLSIVASD